MDKQALRVEPSTVARYGVGGLLTGGSVAALLNLAHMIRQQREERQKLMAPDKTDEDTIVLTLPPKAGEVTCKPGDPTRVRRKEGRVVRMTQGPRKQTRRAFDGTFGTKAAAGWPTLTAGWLAGIAGTAAGATLVNHIYQKRRQQDLQAELDAAQQEYADMLAGGGKTAEWVEGWFALPTDKEAAEGRWMGILNYPVAVMALLTALGSGGTAWLTKRILDEKLRENEQRGMDVPRVKRIVFRTAPQQLPEADAGSLSEEDEDKQATAEDIEAVWGALAVTTDRLDSEPRTLRTPAVKQAMAEVGTTEDELLKLSQDADAIINEFSQAKYQNLRRMLQREYMSTHPVLKHFRWALKIPGVGSLADNKLYDKVRSAFAPKAKVAGVGLMGDFATDILGNKLTGGTEADEIAKAIIRAQQAQAEAKPKVETGRIRLDAEDPEAEAYLAANKEKVLALLRRMAMNGQL
jgi:hypothetical protein